MKFFLKSPYPCLVKTGDSACELDQNDILEIENEKFVSIYPQAKNILPFYIDLCSPKDNERYSFFLKDEKKYIILENCPNCIQKEKETFNFSGKFLTIYVENDKIVFETANKRIEYMCEKIDKKYSSCKIKNFACLQFKDELFLYSIKENKVYHFFGESEIDGNQISVTRKFFDSEMHEKKSVFRIEEEIELESEDFSYKPQRDIKGLSPFKFLESVKSKDFAHAMDFLSAGLKNKVEISQIKDFLGNFSSFLPISETEFITLDSKQKHFVQFAMNGNLIEDISVDELN